MKRFRHFEYFIKGQTGMFKRFISAITLYSYILSFVFAPVYASTEVMEPLPSRFGRYDRFDEPVEPVSAPVETPLQQQFRLWQKLPALARAPLPFDEAYQPLGWSDRYQLSLGFDDTHAARVFSIPAGKDFVNAAGAQWLQITYGDLGWNCTLKKDGSALSFSYNPTGLNNTIAFLLDRSGNVRLTALNTKSAIFHAAQKLSLAFVDDAVITPNLIVGAPVVSNETELTIEQLGIFTQRHVNRGRYTVDHGEIRAKTTLNAAFIKATKQFNVNGHSWVNRAAITGDGRSAFVLQENLDNRGQTIQLGDSLSIQAASVNNQQGTLTGLTVHTQTTGSIDNTQGKISSTKRVRINAKTLMNEKGLIRSPYGLDLRNIDDVQVGGIDTHGDVLLKEGQFTFTPATAMGNADGKTEHKIRKLVVEPNPALPEHLPVELLGTINAKAYTAHFSTTLGSDVRIDQVNTDDNAKVTFTPGQIKRLTTRMKDNPLTPELIQDLERLEWLLNSEADVLPYDVNMAGQLILRPIPSGIAIPKWLITKNAHANKGLELHLHDSDIIMGDAAGTTYPEWIADTGPLHMFGKTMDQKSGLIAACAGGSIETQGKLKLGEARETKTMPSLWPVTAPFYKISNRSATIFSGAPLLIASATEDIETVFTHIDAKDLTLRTPKKVAVLSSVLEGEGIWNIEAQHLLISPDDRYVTISQSNDGYNINYYNADYVQGTPQGCCGNHYACLWLHLAKDYSRLSVEGTVRLNLPQGYRFVGKGGHVKGKIEYVHPIPATLCALEQVREHHYISCHKYQSNSEFSTADLSSGTSIVLPARTFTMDGARLRSPIIQIRTADGRIVASGEAALQRPPEPQTLYDLQQVIRTGALTKENPDETGPRIIPRFAREPAKLIPPPVFLIPGQGLTLTPPPGTRLQFDASLEAKALPNALASMGFGQGYLYPRMGSRDEHLLMRTFAYALYKKVERDSPHLIAGGGARALLALTNAQQQAEASGDLISYIGAEGLGNFKDKPMIGYSPQGKPVIFVPKSFAHRSLQSSMTAILADEIATIEGIDGETGSQLFLNGAIDGGKVTELLNDHTTVARPTHTRTHHNSYKSNGKRATETIIETLIGYGGNARGDNVTIHGKTQSFTGTLEATDSYLIHGDEGVEIGVAQQMRQVSRSEQKKGSLGSKSSKHSSEYSSTVVPSVLTVHNPAGKGVISSGNVVHMTSPHFAPVLTEIKARKVKLQVGHNVRGGSSASSSTNPFVNTSRISTYHQDQVVAPVMDGVVRIEADEVTAQRPAGTIYPNLEVLPGAEITDQEVVNIDQSFSKTHRSLGIAPIAALGILGSLAGGWAFTGLFGTGAATGAATVGVVGTAGTAGVATATVGVAGATATTAALTTAEMFSITALGMAKAATMFVGASVFQGVATGHINISARGLAAAVATAGLIGSGPIAGADVSFTDMLGQQTVHAVQTAPIHAAINMAIGQEKFGDAVTSSIRQGVGHAIGASLAHQMGQWYSGPDKINYFMHKMGHFASGAVGGAITGDDPLGGAFGAAFAEVSMEAMADAKAEAALVKQENPNLPKEELEKILHERLIAKRFFSQVIGGFAGTLAGGDFSVAANAAAIALDYNMMPTLLDEACREYYGLTEAALDAREAARPATPRTFAAIKALERYDALKESAHGREYVLRQESEGTTREQVAQVAYELAEQDIALNASWKVFKGEELSSYEQGVRNDFFVAQGLSIFVGRVGGPLAVSAVSKPVAKLVAKGLKSAKPTVKIKAAEMESLYTPQAKTSSSFLQFDTKASAITKKAVNPHGNSLQYAGDTHVYAIRDANGNLYKIGESMKGTNPLGLSKRAEAQARRLYKVTEKKHDTEIRRLFSSKAEAREWETGVIERYRRLFGKDLLPGNKGNR